MFEPDDVSFIEWFGWSTTLSDLKSNGWEIDVKPKYENWRRPSDSMASSNYLYLRHPALKMLAKIKYTAGEAHIINGHVEFMIPEKTHRIKPPRYIDERQYSEDDIAPMLNAIVEIQSKRPRRKKSFPSADLFHMNEMARN